MTEDRPEDVRVTLATLSAKLDYVLINQEKQAGETRDVRVEMRDIKRQLDAVPSIVDERLDRVAERLVTREAFDPVRNIVYGLVGLVLVALASAAVAVLLGPKP